MKFATRFLLVASGLCLSAPTIEAQRDEPVGPRARPDTSIVPRRHVGGTRLFTAVGGVLAGTFVGGVVGYRVLPHDCNCDDPGLDATVYGAFAGMVVGAALAGSAPDLGSVCSFQTRFGRSLAGAALTATAAYFVAGGRGNGGSLIAVPLGAIGGSLAGLGRCWKSS